MRKNNKIKLSVPEPCHENWGNMTPLEKGRHCDSCNKTVVDFSSFTDKEILEFFNKTKGSICGRLNEFQLDRPIVVPVKNNSFLYRLFFGTAIATGSALTAQSQAVSYPTHPLQVPVPVPPDAVPLNVITEDKIADTSIAKPITMIVGQLAINRNAGPTATSVQPALVNAVAQPKVDSVADVQIKSKADSNYESLIYNSYNTYIRGVVVDGQNEPVEGADIIIDAPNYNTTAVKSDSAGHFILYIPKGLRGKNIKLTYLDGGLESHMVTLKPVAYKCKTILSLPKKDNVVNVEYTKPQTEMGYTSMGICVSTGATMGDVVALRETFWQKITKLFRKKKKAENL